MSKLLTDREILEACARAVGFSNFEYSLGTICVELGTRRGDVVRTWNPLTDDGDCFRMENKCGVTLVQMLGASPFAACAGHTKGFTPGDDAERRRASCLVVARAQLAKEQAA
jgi:hypothetical protein